MKKLLALMLAILLIAVVRAQIRTATPVQTKINPVYKTIDLDANQKKMIQDASYLKNNKAVNKAYLPTEALKKYATNPIGAGQQQVTKEFAQVPKSFLLSITNPTVGPFTLTIFQPWFVQDNAAFFMQDKGMLTLSFNPSGEQDYGIYMLEADLWETTLVGDNTMSYSRIQRISSVGYIIAAMFLSGKNTYYFLPPTNPSSNYRPVLKTIKITKM